jgi:hypothetical protein
MTINPTMERLDSLEIINTLLELLEYTLDEINEIHDLSDSEELMDFSYNDDFRESKLLFNILNQILLYCKYSSDRCMEDINFQIIKLCVKVLELKVNQLNKIVLDILIVLIQASETTRNQLWKLVNGPYLLIY